MGTKRYFYTDPLAAAWMAKHFGMVFRENPPQDDGWVSPPNDVRERYIICPDSLHLLEPQDKDIYINTARSPEIWHSATGLSWHKRYKIIQRDGKPFFWPESEVV